MEIQKTTAASTVIKITAEEDGKEVGHARLYLINNDFHDEPYGLLEYIFVEPEYRKKGIGTKLTQAIIDEAKKQGCYKLIGQSRYGKDKVHALYEKIGFKNIQEFPNPYFGQCYSLIAQK